MTDLIAKDVILFSKPAKKKKKEPFHTIYQNYLTELQEQKQNKSTPWQKGTLDIGDKGANKSY